MCKGPTLDSLLCEVDSSPAATVNVTIFCSTFRISLSFYPPCMSFLDVLLVLVRQNLPCPPILQLFQPFHAFPTFLALRPSGAAFMLSTPRAAMWIAQCCPPNGEEAVASSEFEAIQACSTTSGQAGSRANTWSLVLK